MIHTSFGETLCMSTKKSLRCTVDVDGDSRDEPILPAKFLEK